MSVLAYKKYQDIASGIAPDRATAELSKQSLAGTWVNTKKNSQCILKVVITADAETLWVRTFGVDRPKPNDWGVVSLQAIYWTKPGAQSTIAYTAHYDFDHKEVYLDVNVSKGLMVIASQHLFTDASGRSNYFCREFYRKFE